MAHEIDRVLRAFSSEVWLIEPAKAEQIVAMLEFRAFSGPRAEPYRNEPAPAAAVSETRGRVGVISLYGTIVPRAESVQDVSQTAAKLTEFQRVFRTMAADPNVSAIVLDVDSPGGSVALVPETAAMIRAASKPERPIVAVANSLAASAAYWIASAADELVVTPSGMVGSIGVYTVHQDLSEQLTQRGVRMTMISAGPRKVEGNPFEPLGAEARAALEERVVSAYQMFTADVAKHRGVPVSVVRADPEKAERHFGGGRSYGAARAVELGMADRVATLDDTIARLSRGSGRRASTERRRMALI